MTVDPSPGLARILAPDYLDDVGSTSIEALRRKLAEAREQEESLSYVRRVLHAKLDILRDEFERREGGEASAEREAAIDRVKAVLGQGAGGGSRGARAPVSGRAPERSEEAARVEGIFGEAHLARLPDMAPDDITRTLDELMSEEQRVSGLRRRVHGVIDTLEGELVRRFRDDPGAATRVLDPRGG